MQGLDYVPGYNDVPLNYSAGWAAGEPKGIDPWLGAYVDVQKSPLRWRSTPQAAPPTTVKGTVCSASVLSGEGAAAAARRCWGGAELPPLLLLSWGGRTSRRSARPPPRLTRALPPRALLPLPEWSIITRSINQQRFHFVVSDVLLTW